MICWFFQVGPELAGQPTESQSQSAHYLQPILHQSHFLCSSAASVAFYPPLSLTEPASPLVVLSRLTILLWNPCESPQRCHIIAFLETGLRGFWRSCELGGCKAPLLCCLLLCPGYKKNSFHPANCALQLKTKEEDEEDFYSYNLHKYSKKIKIKNL